MNYHVKLELHIQVDAHDDEAAKQKAANALRSAQRNLPAGTSVGAAMATAIKAKQPIIEELIR